MSSRDTRPSRLGGIVHTYLGYDPKRFPSPTQPPPDVVSSAFEHLLTYGSLRRLTDEELARAVRIDPSQIQGLGPSLDALIAMLEERRRRILETYETETVRKRASDAYRAAADAIRPPSALADRFRREVAREQIRDLERLWYAAGDERSPFAIALLKLIERLRDRYEVDGLAARYDFTGRRDLTIEQAIEIRTELEAIDALLEQLRQARETAQVGLIDMEALSQFAEAADVEQLGALQQQVRDYIRELAERQGLDSGAEGFRLTPKAYRIFQSHLLEEIFGDLEAARRGRHTGPIAGEGAVEMPTTRPYEFGDSAANMDITQSLVNAMLREPPRNGRVRLRSEDIEIHRTRNTPKCATAVVMDMSGSMRHNGLYVSAKRMGLALDGLIRSEYPGDFLQFIEMYSIAKARHVSELPMLMPKPVTIHDPIVRLVADMSDEGITEFDLPPHFTNIQHGLRLARQFLSVQDTPNRQLILIT
ncbi:MAG: hypothetical protein KDA25_00610, partial [Phycisphaerales bacterium]|nr:hypothetical protein [Phycisphaerales bacterium]